MNASKILVVDDESDIRRLLQEILTEEGYEVEVAADAGQARAARARQAPDLVLLDIWMPDTDGITLLREWSDEAADGCPVVMMSGHGTVETAVEATRLGAYDFVEKPLSLAKLLRTVERALDERARRPSGRMGSAASAGQVAVGRSRVITQLRGELGRLATISAPLLLLGESGTDREQLARWVHLSGPAAAGPFIVIDGRTWREEGDAASLLGAESAAAGLLDQARHGTLFLGDVEELPDSTQRLLSGILETGRYLRSNGESASFDARIISSARPSIVNRVMADTFRRDLYAQLSVLLLRVPALRDYAEDVPELLRYHVDQLTEHEGLRFRRFSVAAQNRLRNYPWPDNVRELRNLTRRFLLNAGPEEISLEEVERELSSQAPPDEPLVKHDLLALPLREAREHFERAYLQQQLLLCNGRVGLLAKRVDMERTHLYRKLRSLGIEIGHTAED